MIHIFLDANVLPRRPSPPGHFVDQLIEFVKAKLVCVHMSDVAMREWRSQMVEEFRIAVRDMRDATNTVMQHATFSGLRIHGAISQIASDRKGLNDEAIKVAGEACDELFKKLAIKKVGIEGTDAGQVFEAYFAGNRPFGQPKLRKDIPDAFIHCAAVRFALNFPNRVAICDDARLRKALAELPGVETFTSIKEFLGSDLGKGLIPHLEMFKVWTPEKRKEATALLVKKSKFVEKQIETLAENKLAYYTISHPSFPTDNEEAIIDGIYGVDDLEVDWDASSEIGPGWITVPFKFKTDVDLSMSVYRMDAFHMPEWIHVEIGDFEEEHYFDASASRRMEVRGSISFRFAKEEVAAKPVKLPSSVEIEDLEFDFIDKVSDYPDDYEPDVHFPE